MSTKCGVGAVVLRVNEENVAVLSPMDERRFRMLEKGAVRVVVAEADSTPAASTSCTQNRIHHATRIERATEDDNAPCTLHSPSGYGRGSSGGVSFPACWRRFASSSNFLMRGSEK